MNRESVPRHPIRVAARRTGLSTATIRAWERRYGAVSPGRSSGGRRLYSDRDLARLLVLRRLTELGRSIGSVAALSDDQAAALLEEDRGVSSARSRGPEDEPWRERAYAKLLRLDAGALERTLRRARSSLGARAFLLRVAAPLLEQIGEGWQAGEVGPAQEHLASAVIEQLLAEVACEAEDPEIDSPCLLVATLPGERHAMGARMAAATAALEGWSVGYLGPDLPPGEIAAAARALEADVVGISIVSYETPDLVLDALRELREALPPHVELCIGGRASLSLDQRRVPRGIDRISDLATFRSYLADPTRVGPARTARGPRAFERADRRGAEGQ